MIWQRLILICAVGLMACSLTGCITTRVAYASNGQVLLDVMEGAAPELVVGVQLGAKDSIALVDLDTTVNLGSYPSAVVYDMLVMALLGKGYTVVERNARGFYASSLEGSGERLPLHLGGPCSAEADRSAVPAEGADGEQGAPATSAGVDCSARPQVMAEHGYPEVYELGVPECLCDGADPVQSEQVAATHLLGYRVLYYGVTLEDASGSGWVDRVVRIDLLLRLIDTKHGVVTWADRVSLESRETVPESLAPLLGRERFEYQSPQFGGVKEGADRSLDGAAGRSPVATLLRAK